MRNTEDDSRQDDKVSTIGMYDEKDFNITYATVWMVSVVYGLLAVPVDF